MVHSPQVIDLHCLKLFKKPFVNISEHFLHFNEENNMAKSYKRNDDTPCYISSSACPQLYKY